MLLGGAGDDVLAGNGGFDYLYGEAGADTFVFAQGDGADWVLDFSPAQGDRLKLVGFGITDAAALRPLLTDRSTPGLAATAFDAPNPGGGFDELILFGVAPAALESLVLFA